MYVVARGRVAGRLLLATAIWAALGAGHALAQADIGVVLMHGKQATPDRPPGLEAIAAQLQRAGMKVVRPQMPWARGEWERIAVTVEAVHAQIDGMVAQLRAQGARRIVVGGHSIGANVALSYAVERGNVAAVFMIGPGHAPGMFYQRMPDVRASVDRAAALVQSGQGGQPFTGADSNQGRSFTISTTAEVYLSWLAPRRLANMQGQAPRLSPKIPVLMVIGTQDRAFATAEPGIFKPAAKHLYSKYFAVSGDHASVVGIAGGYVAEWLQALPRQ